MVHWRRERQTASEPYEWYEKAKKKKKKEYYSALKRKEILTDATRSKNPKEIMLSEISQSQIYLFYIISSI